MKNLIVALIPLVFIGCKPVVYEDTIYDSKSPEYNDIYKKYTLLNETIYSIFESGNGEDFSQESETSDIIPTNSGSEISSDYIVDEKEYYAKYFIMRDNGKIVYIKKYRANGIYAGESNENQLSYTSYFDYDGNLIYFEKEEYPFAPYIEFGNFRERSTYLYNKKHELLKKTFDLSEICKNGKKNIPVDYDIFMTVDEYLSKNKFKLENEVSNPNNSTISNENQSSSNEENSDNEDLPMSKYFKITKINKVEYGENKSYKAGVFAMDFELTNTSNYKFSTVVLRADIFYKMKNSDQLCQATVQFNEMHPKSIENWEPNTIKKINFITPCSGCPGGCIYATYDRTPEEITLVIKVDRAISVDAELEGIFAKYDLLDLWKDRQVKEGLR